MPVPSSDGWKAAEEAEAPPDCIELVQRSKAYHWCLSSVSTLLWQGREHRQWQRTISVAALLILKAVIRGDWQPHWP